MTYRSGLAVLAIALAAFVAPSTAAELPSLVGHWKLDEGGGVTAMDSSGFGRHGAIAGGSYVTNGLAQITPNAFALQLNGSGGHIAIPDSPDWNLTPSSTLTISLWVSLLEDRGIFHVFGKRQGCDGSWFYQLARDHRGFFFMSQGGAVIADRPLAPGWLTHVAVTYDAGQVRLYMDGVLAGSGVAPMTTTPAGPLLFGTSGSCDDSQTFPGIVDDLRIYRGALTGEQIAELGARQGTVFVPLRPTLTWSVRSVNTVLDEQALSATASVSGTFTYSPGLGSVLPAGPATLNVHFEPEDRSRYSPVDLAIQVTVVERAVSVAPLAQVGVGGVGLAVDTTTNRLFAPDHGDPGGVVVLDGETLQPIGRIQLPGPPGSIAIHPSAGRAYALAGDGNTRVLVIDTSSLQVVDVIDLPFQTWLITVDTATGLLYLPGPPGPPAITVIDPARPTQITTFYIQTG